MCGEASIAADPSMDMFSLGVLAWEVMTGKRFFGDASDGDVRQMLMGHKLLPSEGDKTVLAQITDKNAQRLLRYLLRRPPSARWDAAKVASCLWFKTSDFQAYRVTG
jgi:serine/threonine protein kinase